MSRNGQRLCHMDASRTRSTCLPAGPLALVYTFDNPATLEYGCHVPGHYAAGMRGTISIS